jgi:dTDP-4-amino-4,6-dideoxygalactose transaminase
MTSIPSFDYLRGLEEDRTETLRAVERVLDSGRLVLGPEVEAFEEEFAAYLGIDHVVGVANGTDAITLALRALEIGQGDEVITVANTAVPTIAGIRATGAIPVFVDVDPDRLLMDPGGLEQALSERTRAVIPVHLFGDPAPISQIQAFAEHNDLHVIEDCAQAHGARWEDRLVGTYGVVNCFSFYPTKNLGAFGDAGACSTSSPDIARRLRMLRTYGFDGDGHAHIEGYNSRLDEVHAAILRVRLRALDRRVAARRDVARQYRERLEGVQLPPGDGSNSRHAYHLFAVRVSRRDDVRSTLEADGIGTGIHYPEPIHRMEAYGFLGYPAGSLPVTEAAGSQLLSLPMFPEIRPEEIDHVADAVNDAVRRHEDS